MADTRRRWAVAVFGDSTLDLRQAVGDEVEIVAVAVFGDVDVIVAPGSRVELSGVAVFGDKRNEVSGATPAAIGPVVKVKGFALVGDVEVR